MNSDNKSQICLILKIGIKEKMYNKKIINTNYKNVDTTILFKAQRQIVVSA